jgi:hypothetical protein
MMVQPPRFALMKELDLPYEVEVLIHRGSAEGLFGFKE